MAERREESLAGLDHRHLQAEAPQRGSGLHPDEARADDEHPPGRAGRCSHAERVVQGPVGEDALEVLAGNPEPPWGRPGCEHEPVVAELLAVGEHDLAGARVDRHHARFEPKVDLELGVRSGRIDEHRIRLDRPAQQALGERWAVVGEACLGREHRHPTVAAGLSVAPADPGGGHASADDHDPVGHALLPSSIGRPSTVGPVLGSCRIPPDPYAG